jgi:adenosylmethionine---8-amino-7-oxononanoate aminotransferase
MNNVDKMHLWYPYVQMKKKGEYPRVVSAKGVYMTLEDGTKLIDSISSWWCMIHGYSNDEINKAMFEQIEKLPHVMLGGLTHATAEKLSEKLAQITPGELNHTFFSDSGSVGVEVALKIAVQYYINQNRKEKSGIISLKKGYHGDTFKAMEISGDTAYRSVFNEILTKGYFAETPSNNKENFESEIKNLEKIFEENSNKIAAFIVEPILQCAGGFNVYNLEYLNKARELCDKYDVLLIFDEVATGFGRTGKLFATEHCSATPDIMVLGKGLTAGYGGHAATIVTKKVFKGFYSDKTEDSLMHGPTFMANPVICAVALKSIEIFQRDNYIGKIKKIENILKDELFRLKSNKIKEIRVLGAMGVVELNDSKDLIGFQEFAIKNEVWIRPFDRYIYTMPPYIISKDELLKITTVIRKWFEKEI